MTFISLESEIQWVHSGTKSTSKIHEPWQRFLYPIPLYWLILYSNSWLQHVTSIPNKKNIGTTWYNRVHSYTITNPTELTVFMDQRPAGASLILRLQSTAVHCAAQNSSGTDDWQPGNEARPHGYLEQTDFGTSCATQRYWWYLMVVSCFQTGCCA